MSISDELKYWEDILEDEGMGDIDNGTFLEIVDYKDKIEGIIENIDDVEDNIDYINEDGILKFYLEGITIGVIEYSKADNNEIYIDMIGNINADIEDFDNYDLKERYDFEKKDIKIKGLIYFMYTQFFNLLKNKGYNKAFGAIENKNLYHINDELVSKKIIKKSYTRKNKYNKEELVREF